MLTNSWTGGSSFYNYVLSLLLSARFGLNTDIGDAVLSRFQDGYRHVQEIAAQARPVDPAAIAPYLGYYQHGYQLAFAAGALRLQLSARATRLLAMPDGSYIAASGILAGTAVQFSRDSSGNPQMQITSFETVHWLSGQA